MLELHAAADPPKAVIAAMNFVHAYHKPQERSPYYCREESMPEREPTIAELQAIGSACDLIVSYFDRHNAAKVQEAAPCS